MVDPNAQGRALTPYYAKSDVKGSNISQGKIFRMAHCTESGYFYEVRLLATAGSIG